MKRVIVTKITEPVEVSNGLIGITGTISTEVTNSPNVSVVNIPHVICDSGLIQVTSLPTVSINNFPATQQVQATGTSSVSVTNWPSLQGITGTVTANITNSNIFCSGSTGLSVASLPNVTIGSMPQISGTVGVTGAVSITNSSLNINGGITGSVSINSSLGSPVYTSSQITNTLTVTGTVSLGPTGTDGLYHLDLPEKRMSAFGELMTTHPTIQTTHGFFYNQALSRFWTETKSASSTIVYTNNMAKLNAPGAPATQSCSLVSKAVLQYIPGVGSKCRFAALYSGGGGISSYGLIGLGSLVDGFFFGYNDGGVNLGFTVCAYRNGSLVLDVPVASWNGKSLTFDVTKLSVYQIAFQWLGGGKVIFSMENPADGEIETVHTWYYPSSATVPSIFNPSLQFGAYCKVGNSVTLCSSHMSYECPINERNLGVMESYFNTKSVTTRAAVFSLRAESTFNSLTWRGMSVLDSISILNTTAVNGILSIWLNATLGGSPSYSSHSSTSPVFVDTAGTTLTGGTLLFTIFISKDGHASYNLPRIEFFNGDIITVASTAVSGTFTPYVSLTYYNFGTR